MRRKLNQMKKLTLISKSNGMRRTAREKEEHVKLLEGEIEQKLQEVKSSM